MEPERGRTKQAPAFVGRADELDRLRASADVAAAGSGRFILLKADAGLGKTTLVNRFARELDPRWRTANGFCVELSHAPPPLAPLAGATRALLRAGTQPLAPWVLDDLAPLLPEFAPRGNGAEATAEPSPERLFDALGAVLAASASDGPVLVSIEDVHWADPATLDALSYLERQLQSVAVLFVLTYRTERTPAPLLRTWLGELARRSNVEVLELRPFGRTEIAQLVLATTGTRADPALVGELLARSEGSPFIASELLIAHLEGRTGLTGTLADFLHARLDLENDDKRAVLGPLAVGGALVSHPVLEAVCTLDPATLRNVLRNLVSKGTVANEGDSYRFRHSLLREAVLDALLPYELIMLNERFAQVKTARLRAQPSAGDLSELVEHWQAAGNRVETIRSAIAAGDAAALLPAFSTALTLYRVALETWEALAEPDADLGVDRLGLLLRVAAMTEPNQNPQAGIDLLNDAERSWGHMLSEGERALVQARRALLLTRAGQPEQAEAAMTEAVAWARTSLPDANALFVLTRQAELLLWSSRAQPALDVAREVIAMARNLAVEIPREALVVEATALGLLGDHEAALRTLHQLQQRAVTDGDTHNAGFCFVQRERILLHTQGVSDAMMREATEAVSFARRHCGRRVIELFELNLALQSIERLDLDEARAILGGSMDQLHLPFHTHDALEVARLQARGRLAFVEGDLALARQLLHEASGVAEQFHDAQNASFQARLEADVERAAGDLSQAETAATRAVDAARRSADRLYEREATLVAARVLADIATQAQTNVHAPQQPDHARDKLRVLVESFVPLTPCENAYAHALVAELRRATGDIDTDDFRAAAADLDAHGLALDSVSLLVTVVEALARAGKRAQAASIASETEPRLRSAGATQLHQRLLAIAKAAKLTLRVERVPPVDAPGAESAVPFALTEREMDVLAELARGLTNKEIAQALYLSDKTVKSHVSSILTKLNVPSRGQAVAAAQRAGLVTIDLRDRTPYQA